VGGTKQLCLQLAWWLPPSLPLGWADAPLTRLVGREVRLDRPTSQTLRVPDCCTAKL